MWDQRKLTELSHSEELNSIEIELAYIKLQGKVTNTDILLFRHGHDLATKKRKKAQKQIYITNLLNK
jgi:hypothetical protein